MNFAQLKQNKRLEIKQILLNINNIDKNRYQHQAVINIIKYITEIQNLHQEKFLNICIYDALKDELDISKLSERLASLEQTIKLFFPISLNEYQIVCAHDNIYSKFEMQNTVQKTNLSEYIQTYAEQYQRKTLISHQEAIKYLEKNILPPQDMNLFIIPAIAFNQDNYRLGRGGGYYDRLIKKVRSVQREQIQANKTTFIGLCISSLQLIDFFPEQHDEKLDDLILI